MEKKTLEKIYGYLPVIQATCDRYGWAGGRGHPIEKQAVVDTRKFFDYLATHIPLQDIPYPEDIYGDPMGCIAILWETELDPVEVTYDTFEVTIMGDGFAGYSGKLESTGTEAHGGAQLEPELCSEIIEHVKFFKRRKDEQEQISKSATSQPVASKQVQQEV